MTFLINAAAYFLLFCAVSGQSCNGSLDYSTGVVKCVVNCPPGSVNKGRVCCAPSQFLYNNTCRACSGWVVNDGLDCCNYGEYYSQKQKQCRKCPHQTYLSGKLCCSGCEYVDMTYLPICVANGQGGNPNLTCTSVQKIFCPNQQYFYIPEQICKNLSPFDMNCNEDRRVCCAKGNYIDYVNRQLSCVQRCTYGVRIDDSLCADKYCTFTGTAVLSLYGSQSNSLATAFRQCCLGFNTQGQCVRDLSDCGLRFRSNLLAICCPKNKFYDLLTKSCLQKCIGIISVKVFCIPAGSYIDFTGDTPKIVESVNLRFCNGILLPLDMTICCPKGSFSHGTNGCTFCHGRIFGTTDYQTCCANDQTFNPITNKCSKCRGAIDSSGTLCCPTDSYLSYNTDGTRSCIPECSIQKIRNGSYCCQMCQSNCAVNTLSCSIPKVCSPSYFVPKSCSPCQCGTCVTNLNSELCTSCNSSFIELESCIPICSQRKVLDQASFTCLDCDGSCGNCTSAMDNKKCVGCREGFAPNKDNACQLCKEECLQCGPNPNTCTSCNQNSELPVFFSSTCAYACHYGNFIDKNTTCSPCNPNCYYCVDSSPKSCISCYNGSYLTSESTCVTCQSSCINCKNNLSCTSCRSDLSLQNGICVGNCQLGYFKKYLSDGTSICQQCYSKCLTCMNSAINCLDCKPNLRLDTSQGNGNCVPCLEGCMNCTLNGDCIGACKRRYFSKDNKTCSKCDITCSSCNGSTNEDCLSCEAGLLLTNGSCTGCSSRCLTCSAPTVCSSCRSGMILDKGQCRSTCPNKTYLVGSQCLPCYVTCATCQNPDSCFTCPDEFPYFSRLVCVASCNQTSYPDKTTKVCTFCAGTLYLLRTGCCLPPMKVVKDNCISDLNNSNKSNSTNSSTDTNRTTPNTNNNSNIDTSAAKTPTLNQHAYVHKSKIYITMESPDNTSIKAGNLSYELLTDYDSNSSYKLNYTIHKQQDGYIDVSTDQPEESYNYRYIRTTYNNQQWYSVELYNQFKVTDQYSHNSGLKSIGIICSIILVIYAVACKCKGHYEAEQANRLVLHSLNFCQIVGLFRNVYFPRGKLYNFLQGFRWSHFSFFYNAFKAVLPEDYIEPNQPNGLQPDACLIRNAGFSITLQLFLVVFLVVALIVVYSLYYCKHLDEPPFIRLIMRVFICLFSMTFMNLTLYAIAQLCYHKHYQRHHSIYNSNFVASIFVVILIPCFITLFSLHNLLTYMSDELEHLYSLRQISQLLQVFMQGIIMGISIERYYTVALIGVELLWFVFNISLWTDVHWTDNIKHYVTQAVIIVGYILLIVGKQADVGTIVVISLVMTVLITYCTYQVVGLYYWDVAALFGYYQSQDPQVDVKQQPEAVPVPVNHIR